MKVSQNSIVIIVNWSNEVKDDIIDLVGYLMGRHKDKVFFTLKPTVITTIVKDVKRQLVIPPSSLILTNPYSDELKSLLSTWTKSITSVLVIAEDVWVEAKPIVISNHVNVNGTCNTLEAILKKLNIKLIKEIDHDGSCLLICSNSSIDLLTYLSKEINKRHIAFLTGIKGIDLTRIRGQLHSLWRHHPIFYGLDLWGKELDVEVAVIGNIEKLRLLSKPLLFIDGTPILLELPFNNSIIFTVSPEVLDEVLLLKTLLYVC